ncbi:hypothetical protein GF351_03385 [Candidatus Woesearchaeota archaeon]|nr:hypothetical protein [Candidatus Woesearchaeota archaeon]
MKNKTICLIAAALTGCAKPSLNMHYDVPPAVESSARGLKRSRQYSNMHLDRIYRAFDRDKDGVLDPEEQQNLIYINRLYMKCRAMEQTAVPKRR